MDDLIAALTILRKYGNPTHPTNCSHDELFVCIGAVLVSPADKEELSRLGFFVEDDGFKSFRFGSC